MVGCSYFEQSGNNPTATLSSNSTPEEQIEQKMDSETLEFSLDLLEVLRLVRDTRYDTEEGKSEDYYNNLLMKKLQVSGEEIQFVMSRWMNNDDFQIARAARNAHRIGELYEEIISLASNAEENFLTMDALSAQLTVLKEDVDKRLFDIAALFVSEDPSIRISLTDEEKGRILETVNRLFITEFAEFDQLTDDFLRDLVLLEPELFAAIAIRAQYSMDLEQ